MDVSMLLMFPRFTSGLIYSPILYLFLDSDSYMINLEWLSELASYVHRGTLDVWLLITVLLNCALWMYSAICVLNSLLSL